MPASLAIPLHRIHHCSVNDKEKPSPPKLATGDVLPAIVKGGISGIPERDYGFKMSVTPMSHETFELRFEGCGHTMKVSLQHNANDEKCYVCHPELRDVPAPGKCPACLSVAKFKSRGA
jgi:hypothetical protein